MDIKNIFIFNATLSDLIVVDGVALRPKADRSPTLLKCKSLRVTFPLSDFTAACALGMGDALDTVVLDANTVRGEEEATMYNIYGRRNKVSIHIP